MEEGCSNGNALSTFILTLLKAGCDQMKKMLELQFLEYLTSNTR